MRVVFDTNVVLDVLLAREPWAASATRLFARVELGDVDGVLGATTVTTIYYLASSSRGKREASVRVRELLGLFDVAAVTRNVLAEAIELGFEDYEDAVLHESARHARVEGIVTRDREGFNRASLPVFTPDELLSALEALDR